MHGCEIAEETGPPVFIFSSFKEQPQVRADLVSKIERLGGVVVGGVIWRDDVTHVVTGRFEDYKECVLGALAAGRWVVTRREVWQRDGRGLFSDLRVVLLLANQQQRRVYARLVAAGGGEVLEDWSLPQLIENQPGAEDLNCVVADCDVLSGDDPRHGDFMRWQEVARDCGNTVSHIYFKYFLESLLQARRLELENFSIFMPHVLERARAEGNHNMAVDRGLLKRERHRENGENKRRKVEDEGATVLTTTLLPATVTLYDTDSDDDIQVLEHRLIARRTATGWRRTYTDSVPSGARLSAPKVAELVDLVESGDEGSESSGDCEVIAPEPLLPLSDDDVTTVAAVATVEDDGIEVISAVEGGSQPREPDLQARIFKSRLKQLQTKEEGEGEQFTPVEAVQDVVKEKPEVTPIPLRTPTEVPDKIEDGTKLRQLLEAVVQRQVKTEECLVTSEAAVPKLLAYDRHREAECYREAVVRPVEAHVREEFQQFQQQQLSSSAPVTAGGQLSEQINQLSNYLSSLRYLRSSTSLLREPTAPLLHCLMVDYLMEQSSLTVCLAAARYLHHLLFLQLGRDQMVRGRNRSSWEHLVLASCRVVDNRDQLDSFTIDNPHDLAQCGAFFAKVLHDFSTTEDASSGRHLLFTFLTRLITADFELWWRQFRRRNDASSLPLLYYLLEGAGRMRTTTQTTVVALYRRLLTSHRHRDLVCVRRLLAVCGHLAAYLDTLSKQAYVFSGTKVELAAQVATSLAGLGEQQLKVELCLLQPPWLSLLVAKRLLMKETKRKVSSLSDLLSQLSLAGSSGLGGSSVTDLLAYRLVSCCHLHTLSRSAWHLQGERQSRGLLTWRGLETGAPDDVTVTSSQHKTVRWRSEVSVAKESVIEDINTILDNAVRETETRKSNGGTGETRAHGEGGNENESDCNRAEIGQSEEWKKRGLMAALLFKMTSPTEF